MYVAAVGTEWSLLGSLRNGQGTLYLFQKTFTIYYSAAVCVKVFDTVLTVRAQAFSASLSVHLLANNWQVMWSLSVPSLTAKNLLKKDYYKFN